MSRINVSELSHASNGGDPNIELHADGSTSIRNLQNQYPKSLIINGDMSVAQRATSVADIDNAGFYTVDRIRHSSSNLGTARFTVSQEADGPANFSYCYRLETTTAQAAGTNTGLRLQYIFEGNDLKNLNWGTADARPLTVSFWVNTSVQGAYSLNLYRDEATARNIGTAFTVAAGEINNWKFVTHTFPGDQTTPVTLDASQRLTLSISMAEGSDFTTQDNTSWGNYTAPRYAFGQTAQLHTTVNSTFRITGLQVTATDEPLEFQHESLSETLSKCQRYYQVVRGGIRNDYRSDSSASFGGPLNFFATCRVTPTATVVNTVSSQNVSSQRIDDISPEGATMQAAGIQSTGGIAGQLWIADIALDAEL